MRFTVDYHGRIRQGYGLYFFKGDGRPHRPEQVYSGGGTDGNPRWIPTWGGPADKATWEMIATLPARLTVVSNGRLVSTRPAPRGERTTHWRQERPASTYLISLAAAPFVKLADRWRGIPVDYYVYREDSARARPLFGVTPDMMEVYSRLTGVPYPWSKYAQVTVADFVGGMENVSATTLVDWLPDARAYRDRPWYRESLIPHELAHQWFGDLVTAENWANYWLNEGMAEFMPGQYWGVKQGPHAEQDYYLAEYRQFLGLDARRRMPLATYNSNNVYPKGALVLEMLKAQLGPERFWAAMRRYLTRNAYGSATSDDLRQAVLDATGESLPWFWSQWIYSGGLSGIRGHGRRTTPSRARSRSKSGRRRPTPPPPTAPASAIATPLVFRAPLAIRVGTVRGRRRPPGDDRPARAAGADRPTCRPRPPWWPSTTATPSLKTLAFEQPTPWLATLLERHPHLWQRAWAIEQLGSPARGHARRRGAGAGRDRAPTTALTRAARRPRPRRVPAGGGPARARGRGARHVGRGARGGGRRRWARVGGERALAVARDAWRADSSDQVRATALLALVRLGGAGAREAVLQGLETPSYREAIQNVAVTAVVQHPDSGLVLALSRQLGAQPFPAIGLAVLTSRGDTTARGAVRRALDDERPWVREWMLAALEDQLEREATRWRCCGRRSRRYDRPEARTEVTRAISRLARPPS